MQTYITGNAQTNEKSGPTALETPVLIHKPTQDLQCQNTD